MTSELVQHLLHRVAHLGSPGATSRNLVAFSGGVDSSLVAALVFRAFPETAMAVLGISAAVPREQITLAREVASDIGIPLREIPTYEGDNPQYVANVGDACFHCKTELYTTLEALGRHASNQAIGLSRSGRAKDFFDVETSRVTLDCNLDDESNHKVVLFNGTNADDMQDPTRVGLVAAENFQVASPLSDISKDEVRQAALHLGLQNHAHAAAPCLRSRLSLGVIASEDHLVAVEKAERIVREHMHLRVSENMRVRLLPGGKSALEVDADRLVDALAAMPKLAPVLDSVGFPELSLREFKSGSVNGLGTSTGDTM